MRRMLTEHEHRNTKRKEQIVHPEGDNLPDQYSEIPAHPDLPPMAVPIMPHLDLSRLASSGDTSQDWIAAPLPFPPQRTV
jgi:hypothetical protein